MQHFSTPVNAAYKFFKTFRANPAWAKCVGRDRGVEYFREDRQHTISVGTKLCTCAVYLRENIQPPLSRPTHFAYAGLARNVLKNL